MSNTPEPLAIYDVAEDNWRNLEADQVVQLAAWLREQGIDPNDTVRIEIHQRNNLFVRVHQFQRDEHGHRVVENDQMKRGTPYDVPITIVPPVKPWQPNTTDEGATDGATH